MKKNYELLAGVLTRVKSTKPDFKILKVTSNIQNICEKYK
jgi:hypothetical protein